MFLKPEQQLERCKRIVRQRVDPHIHPSIAQLAVESFDIPGEPMPTDEFFEKLREGRKFGLGVWLSSQFLGNYSREEMDTLMQAGNMMIF